MREYGRRAVAPQASLDGRGGHRLAVAGTSAGVAYWIAATEDARGDAQRALAAATVGLQMLSRVGNDELQWRWQPSDAFPPGARTTPQARQR